MPRPQQTKTLLFKIALSLGLSAVATLGARADIIPTFSSVTASGADFKWDYSTAVTQDEKTVGGTSYFTIYDFAGFVPGSNTQPAGWSFSSALVGQTPANVSPVDNPKLLNLTWTYTGATKTGPFDAGQFTALSTDKLVSLSGDFAARATRAVGPDAGQFIDNVGSVAVPVPEMSALMPIIAVCGLAIASFAASAFRRRQTAL